MSDQQPVYTPPPFTPPPPSYGGDTLGVPMPGDTPQPPIQPPLPPAPKKKTALIIGLVVAGVLLCCCVTLGGAIAFLVPTEESSTVSTDVRSQDSSDDATDAYDDERMQEWLDWDPEVNADILPLMPSEKEALVLEGLGIVAPGFEYDEAVWWQGGYNADEDWYYPDYFYVRAYHPSSDRVSAALELLIEGDEMAAVDVEYTPDDGNSVDAVDGGSRVLEWTPVWGSDGFELASDDEEALWERIGEQWPDAVVLGLYDTDLGSDYAVVDISTWELYRYDAAVPYVTVTYQYADGEWTLWEWEYVDPDETASSAT